ncbi:DUF975 family protein [Fructobacillus sp. M1-13]|uniref:DUF975 family protein n=1 Tax=Fructobacillus papyriferae TaxID=2713171 RepID=A0ABS5QPG8_9LACO|nr:DUF975 family protein [Fructobacillus papyriferae]MBS9335046.1 DUF975 family protein [Fructobacillus papyriferae]MCD2159468.1 DUF975 family protein [Fructobacillus papyriferae]
MNTFEPISRRRIKLTAKKQLKEQFQNSLRATWPLVFWQIAQTALLFVIAFFVYQGYVLSPSSADGSWYLSRTFFSALGLLLTWSAKWAIVDFFQKPDVKKSFWTALQAFSPRRFSAAFLLAFVQRIQLFFWSFLVLPPLVKVFSYSQTYYAYKMDLLFDRKQRSLTDYITISRRVMQGRKRELFLLELSFIGWHLFAILTLGLGYLFVTPYLNTCRVVYSTQVFAKAIEGVQS